MVTPLSPCDLNEFDVETAFLFGWGACMWEGGEEQKDVNQFCTLVSSQGIQTGRVGGREGGGI